MAPSALYFSIVRNVLRHRSFYNTSIAPFFNQSHPFTLKWILSEQDRFQRVAMIALAHRERTQQALRKPSTSEESNVFELTSIIRLVTAMMPQEATLTGLDAIGWLDMMKHRVANTPPPSERELARGLCNVGDIVVRKDIHQRGVVAAVLPFCFQSTEWVEQHLGSIYDKRLVAPWYLVLVEHTDVVPLDFTRYASSLTHVQESTVLTGRTAEEAPAYPSKAIGMHRFLPLFFRGFDAKKGVYIPHNQEDLKGSGVRWVPQYGPGVRMQSTTAPFTTNLSRVVADSN